MINLVDKCPVQTTTVAETTTIVETTAPPTTTIPILTTPGNYKYA